MNKYEIEDIVSGDAMRDEKQEELSECEFCKEGTDNIIDDAGPDLCVSCFDDAGYGGY